MNEFVTNQSLSITIVSTTPSTCHSLINHLAMPAYYVVGRRLARDYTSDDPLLVIGKAYLIAIEAFCRKSSQVVKRHRYCSLISATDDSEF